MRLSIWQFLGIVVGLVGLYYVYTHWWVDQDRNTWINRWNNSMINSKDDYDDQSKPPAKDYKGWK